MNITGKIIALDPRHIGRVVATDTNIGSIYAIDQSHQGHVSGFVIDKTYRLDTGATFVPNQFTTPSDLALTLTDRTYIDGSYSGDGTYFDSTYISTRWFNPIWINYGIWMYDNTDSTNTADRVLQGYRYRTPMNPQIGTYYANMAMPQPGKYDIQWLYQKDTSSYAKAVDQSFYVTKTW